MFTRAAHAAIKITVGRSRWWGLHNFGVPIKMISLSTGAALCQACLDGEFKPVLGNVSCSSCPADSSTLGTNSTSIDFCLCNPGFTPTAEDEHGFSQF